ncbi:MAG: choice-of-anchor D domain-containing protein [bacterium]|nr:choice-of-anchor D domain-containing protein [bacterium]
MLKLSTIFSSILIFNSLVFAQGITISPPNLDFGSVIVGTNSTLQSTISNTDTIDLVISNITSSAGQFTFSPNVFPITILAGGSQVVDVTFTPTATGLLTGDLTIVHNATGSPTVYSVQGTGVEAGFSISPPSLNFGNVVVGTGSTLQSTISNTGTSDLVISNITSSAGQFTFSPNVFPITILAGGSQVVDVTFTPTATGLLTGDLTITHNATGSPTVYSVQGTGVAAGFSISPPSLNFGSVVVGTGSTLQSTISNTGTSDLVISNITSSAGQFTFSPNVFPITILAGGSQIVDVTFTPTATGLLTGDLTITHNATGSPTVYSVQGTGVAAGFSISPPSLNFGNVVVGTGSTLQSTVSNTGTSDLIISNITSSAGQFTFSPNVFPITILAGGSQVVDVTFTPTATGLLTGDLTIVHNATGSPTVYSVQGTGVAAGFSISPPSLNFGNVVVGTGSTLQSTISNTGTSDLVISNITSSAGQFTFSPNVFPITILAGGSQIVDVTFTPTATGLLTGDLTITHNATGSPTVYSVQGTGVAGFSISPPSLNFGSVVVGTGSTLQSTISNTGTSDLVISNITSSAGQFTFSPNVFPITILAGGSQIVDVTFTPTATGLLTGDLTITHNATGSPTVYSVQGTGVAAGFSISPPSLNFGSVVVGTGSTLQSTISNTGTSDLVISNITSSAGQFTFSPNVFPITILAGGSQIVDVTFTPTATGLLTGDLTITHNATGSPTVYSVQGTGVAAGFSISPPSLNFGNVVVGTGSTLQSTISNTGTSDLVISNITSSAGQFTFSPNVFPITILAGGSQIVDVTFTPTATGLLTGDLTITHNATGSPTVYSVQGTGIEAFSSSINLLNLVNVITSTVVDTQITITNNYNNPLIVSAEVIGASNWSISPDTAIIPASSSLIFALSFSAPSTPNVFADTLVFNASGFNSLNIPLTANVVSDAGIIFEQDSVYRLEDNSYVEVMQLKNLTDSLHALQFRIQVNKEISDDVILIFQNIQKGSDISDASWIMRYTITRGPITPNGASADEVFVLLYNSNQGVSLAPGDYNNLFRINYTVADLEPLQDSLKSTFRITHVEGSTYQGLPVDITPSRDLLTVIARNRISWRGDVNSDGYLDVLDLIMVVDHIVNVDSLNATEFFRADIAPWLPGTPAPEPDGVVNVQELSLIQNIILTGYYPDGTPIGSNSFGKHSAFNGEEDAKVTFYVNKDGIKGVIDTKIGIRGAQVEFANVSTDPGNMLISTDLGQGFYFYVNANQLLRTLMYDPIGEKYIEAGEHFLAEMPFLLEKPEEVTLDKIILVDINREKLAKIQVEIIYGEQVSLPEDYALFQNYPNPFNPATVIEFTLPEDVGNARISIYNALGEKVDELVNTSLQAGYHSYQWNANDFATGMYIYELRTEKFVAVKKMVLVK